jgi:hypothetical protein
LSGGGYRALSGEDTGLCQEGDTKLCEEGMQSYVQGQYKALSGDTRFVKRGYRAESGWGSRALS